MTNSFYSLHEIEKRFRIPVRKISFLIRKDLISPIIKEGKLFIPEREINRYLSIPKSERKKHHLSYLKTLGPGWITGASDNDSSGVITYSVVGAAFGLALSWLAVYLLPMMTAVQETCARIGIVTGKGLAGALRKHYSKRVIYFLAFFLVIANTINIGADIGAMAASLQLLVPVNFYLGAIIFTLLMLFMEIAFKYKKYSRVLKWLTFTLFAYIITGIIIKPDWIAVGKSVAIPDINFSATYLAAMVAVMGTTISPYLFFWQTSEEIEEEREKGILKEHHKLAVKHELKEMRQDTVAGMSLANIVFLFIVITTAFVLNRNGITTIETAEQAAMALRPFAGDFAYLLFTLGIIGTGLLAVPILAGSSAYAIAEVFKWHEGLNQRYSRAKGFYGVIILSMFVGLLMNFIGINPIKALYLAAIVNGLIAPILLFFIFKIGRDEKIMGDFVNPRWVNIWGTVATVLMGLAAIVLIVFTFLGL